MDEKLLIELLEGLTGPQNVNGQVRNALLERCLKASGLDLKEFFDELSQLLRESPDVYLPTLQTFISYLREEYSRATRRRNLQNTALPNFISMLISVVIMKNLRHSDIPGFGELIYDCVELLWQCRDDKPASSTGNRINNQIKLTTKKLFTEILDTEGVFGVLISETSGRRCLKRVLFTHNLYSEIDQRELLSAVDMVGDLLENCSDHKDAPSKLLKEFSVYKACAALSETLKSYKNSLNVGRNSLPLPSLYDMVKLGDEPINNNLNNSNRKRSSSNTDDSTPLSANDEPHLTLLNLVAPRKSELPKFLRDLEQLKTNSLKDLIDFLPCESCHKRALVHLSPDKYTSLMEEGGSTDAGNEFKSNYRLPFEFNDSDGLGPWDILLSEDAIKDMLNLESPLKTKAVMKKLDHISSGLWDKYGLRRKVLTNNIPIYEDKLNSDSLKIIWQIDYGFSIRNYSLTQLVKVWSITAKQEDIDKIENNLMDVCKVYAPEQYHRYAVSQTRDGVILPMFFGDEEGTKSSNDMLHCFDVDNEKLLEVHKMLVTNKFIPLSKNLFKSLVMGGSGFTFNVSKIEYEIINNPTSAIIIGRSGTGKTTCIAFRLVASYLNNQLYKTPSLHVNNGNSYKRQIFITVSYNLCRRVKEYFNKLRESAEFAGKNMTKADFEQFARRREGGGKGIEEDEDDQLLEEGDEDRELGDIPNSFRQLTDDHFPLFITYEKFSRMLQGTYGIDAKKVTTQKKFDTDDDDAHDEEGEELHTKSSASTSDASWFHFVDFDLFQSKYWPRFSDYYRKKLDCGLVYSEFFVIKGTYADVDYLSRKDYKEISIKKFPVFRYNRDEIYDLFERYEKMKAKNYDYDSVDLTLAILRAAKKKALRGPRIHEVYIDECQDNQIIDLALILKLFDRADNVFMAGDIAQCINRGSSFRFQNLRELMYNWERNRSQNNNNSRDALEPKQFELDVNYRSHNGILQIAASVIELIRKFFPDSIDHLKRERSEVGGPRPIFFKGFQAETFLFDVFSVNEQFADCIEFGAEQVIIVRDDDARKRVGKVGIVMTVFEAKGMEFNDVLLYNFFTDSPAKQKWRLILSALDDHSRGLQTFSHEKHYILSSELKHLYVAVTRARQHLWIFDEDAELSDPIRIFWERDNLVKVVQTLEEIGSLPTLIKKSSSHEWNKKGKMFFERRQYELAVFCFKNGGNEESQKLAEAYNLQQIARTSYVNNADEARTNFITAARAFEKCSRPNQAATCYQDIGMHKEAGDVYVRWGIFDLAANCYLKAKMWDKAGDCFKKKEMYTDAVIAYKDGGSYKKVIDLMQKHREEIDEKIFRRITRLINIHYRRENDKEMSKEALSILPTQEEQIELLRDHAPEELLEVCEKSGKFRDAAKDLYSRGKFKEAADMFVRSDDEEDIIEALQCLLYLCRTNVMKNIMTATMSPDILQELKNLHYKAEETVTKAKSQLSKTLKRSDRWISMMEEFQLYFAYLNGDIEGIHKCIQYFKLNGEIPAEFRAINMWLQFIPPFDTEAQIAEYWQERLQYLLRLCDLAFPYIRIVTTRPQNSKDIMKIYKDFEDIFFVRRVENRPSKRKLFFEYPLVDRIQNKEDSVDNWHFYDINCVRNAILYFLAPYIFELISDANQKCREIPYISSEICHKFASCLKPDCKYHHVVPNPSILKQRLTLACLHYSLIQQWELLYHRRLLEEEQSKKVRPTQRRCAESLIKIHFRYQSPQASCPEVTRMMIARLPKPAHKGIIDLANKIWLKSLSENPDDFAVMLKCMLILQQLWDGNDWSINSFGWTMSKVIRLSYFGTLPTGFTYFGYHQNQAIPVGTRLSLFFSLLYSNRVMKAITEMKRFLNYTIDHASLVKMDTFDAFSDLVFLIEFRLSLIFAVGPGYCDFCLPRSYLVNYFDTFTAGPLVSRYRYKRENYWVEIKYSLEQIKQLLDHLIYDERYYLTIILRLIRLLVIIGRNEFNLASRVLGIFKDLQKEVYSMKIKKYLEEKNMLNLVKILRDDLKETDCDSLVIVHYHWGGVSRFSELEKSGVPMIKYKSIEGFRSSLRKIISPVVTEENAETDVTENQLLPQRKQNTDLAFAVEDDDEDDDDEQAVSKEDSETKSQTWFRQIQDSDEAHEAAERIQDWFRRTYERRQVSSQHAHDQILDKVYSDVKDFCCNVSFWEVATSQKGEKVVRKYKILLRGLMVDLIVELTKLQDKMDNIKNKLKKTINNRSTDDEKLEYCLELEDDLKHIHYENVKMTLESLSITENLTMHKEADIKRLESEMQQANSFIDLVEEWMYKCVDAMK